MLAPGDVNKPRLASESRLNLGWRMKERSMTISMTHRSDTPSKQTGAKREFLARRIHFAGGEKEKRSRVLEIVREQLRPMWVVPNVVVKVGEHAIILIAAVTRNVAEGSEIVHGSGEMIIRNCASEETLRLVWFYAFDVQRISGRLYIISRNGLRGVMFSVFVGHPMENITRTEHPFCRGRAETDRDLGESLGSRESVRGTETPWR